MMAANKNTNTIRNTNTITRIRIRMIASKQSRIVAENVGGRTLLGVKISQMQIQLKIQLEIQIQE